MIRNSIWTHKNLQKKNKQTLKNHTKSSPILMKFEVEVDHIVKRLWLKFYNETLIILAETASFPKLFFMGLRMKLMKMKPEI